MIKKWLEKRRITKLLKKLRKKPLGEFKNISEYPVAIFKYEDKKNKVVFKNDATDKAMLRVIINDKEYEILQLTLKQQKMVVQLMTDLAIYFTQIVNDQKQVLERRAQNKEIIWN